MALAHSPRIVTNGLVLYLDAANPKKFSNTLGSNLVTDYYYNPSTWTGVFTTTKITDIYAPDGSKNAIRVKSISKSGTYSVTSNVATITISAHGLTSGSHYFDFTSGTAPDGTYTITVIDTDTITINITTANTSGNVKMYVRAGFRVSIPSFTPNTTDIYVISFWARLIFSSFISGNSITCDLHDSTPTRTYFNDLVQNEWKQIIISGTATASTKTFVDLISDTFGDFEIDLWGLKIENQTADTSVMPINDALNTTSFSLYRPFYAQQSTKDITFTRNAVAPKWGGGVYTTTSGNLTSTNFLYNNHTWEVWFKINDRTATNIDATEGQSCLCGYRGWHAGFMYSSANIFYYIWNSNITTVTCCSWTLGTSGTQVLENQWYQLVVVRNGNVFTPYVNGEQLGTGSTSSPSSSGVNTSNDLHLGCFVKSAPGASNYSYFAKNSISNVKMYDRALSANEVKQNFNALRGRFGI